MCFSVDLHSVIGFSKLTLSCTHLCTLTYYTLLQLAAPNAIQKLFAPLTIHSIFSRAALSSFSTCASSSAVRIRCSGQATLEGCSRCFCSFSVDLKGIPQIHPHICRSLGSLGSTAASAGAALCSASGTAVSAESAEGELEEAAAALGAPSQLQTFLMHSGQRLEAVAPADTSGGGVLAVRCWVPVLHL